MSYSAPNRLSFSTGLHTFSAGDAARNIAVPKGARFARIANIHVSGTTTFNAVTTSAKVQLGNATTASKYANFDVGTLAAGSAVDLADKTTALQSGYREYIDCGAEGENLTDIKLSLIAPTGGTPAGAGIVDITIDWF